MLPECLVPFVAPLAAPPPPDERQIYADLGYAYVRFATEEDLGYDTEADSLITHIGWSARKYLGLEAEIGVISLPRTAGNEFIDVEVKTTQTLGGYATARFPLGQRLTLVSRLGYVKADAEITVEAFGAETVTKDSFTGLGYGAGLRWALAGTKSNLRAEYTKYDLDEIEADAWTIAFQREF